MSNRLVVQAIDYHTAGEPFRIITGGVGPIPGATMLDKRRHAMEYLDRVRQLVVNEPRGHANMYGGFVTAPVSPDGDLGVLFFHNDGFSTACGHGTIALVTAALENGMLPRLTPDGQAQDLSPQSGASCRVVVDVPSGRLETVARLAPSGHVAGVRFRNVPAYVETPRLEIEPEGIAPLAVVIAYGGAFYALVDVRDLGLHVEPAALPALIAHGRAIKRAVEGAHVPVHPEHPDIRGIYGVIFAEPARGTDRQTEMPHARHDVNVTIFAEGEVDRSPCGSGTSARLALLHATGQLALGEPLLHESIIGSRFTGTVVARAEVAGIAGVARTGTAAVITEVEGSAALTGFHTFVLEPDDPLGTGFLL